MSSLKIKAAASLLTLGVLSCSAFADGVSQTYSSTSYAEFNFARNSQDYYAALTTAANGNIDKDGIVFRLEGSLAKYNYTGPVTYGYGGRTAAEISGTQWQGAGLVGYQIVRDAVTYAVYAGVDTQSITLTPSDPTNAARGQDTGAKFIAEIDTDKAKSFYAEFYGSYSTAFDTYFVRGRLGDKYGAGAKESQMAFGPEVSFLGDKSYDAQRLGLFIMLPLKLDRNTNIDVIAAGGYQWVSGNGTAGTDPSIAGGKGGYATLSFSLPF